MELERYEKAGRLGWLRIESSFVQKNKVNKREKE
jgi:hypothetical protein